MELLIRLVLGLSSFGAIVASIIALLVGPKLLTLFLSQFSERYVPSFGVLIPLGILSLAVTFFAAALVLGALGRLGRRAREVWNDRAGVSRAIVRIGDRDIDAWIDEGLSAYGSPGRVVGAGVLTGLILPWITLALAGYLYNLATSWYADSFLRDLTGPISSASIDLVTALFLGAYGGLFALVKRAALRRRLAHPFSRIDWLLRPHVVGTLLGVAFFLLLGSLPQTADQREVVIMIIIIAPVWIALGLALSVYFHWFHARVLRTLYYRDWAQAVIAATKRLLIGHLGVSTPCSIHADPVSGVVQVGGFPAVHGSGRLQELVMRIPGVDKVEVDEIGAGQKPKAAVITIYTGAEGRDAKPVRLLQVARWLPYAGPVAGLGIYVIGTAYLLMRGLFASGLSTTVSRDLWAGQAGLLKQGAVVGLVGWAIGFALHRIVRQRVQRRLPAELAALVEREGARLERFRHGDTDADVHVTADLTRRQAIERLGPVAARYGVQRILLTTAKDSPDVDPLGHAAGGTDASGAPRSARGARAGRPRPT